MKVEYDLLSGRAMETLRVQHGVEFRRLSREILNARTLEYPFPGPQAI
jgi:hypothetical protein